MKKWQTYEEIAAYLLNEFAEKFKLSRVEGKQSVEGLRSGTNWKIDAKGVKEGNDGFIIVECRRYTTSKQNQEKLAGLAYRITDTGANGGIIVSPFGLQKGARKIAEAEKIVEVCLDPNSTPHNFGMQFLNQIMLGVINKIKISESVTVKLDRPCSECGEIFTVKENEKNMP